MWSALLLRIANDESPTASRPLTMWGGGALTAILLVALPAVLLTAWPLLGDGGVQDATRVAEATNPSTEDESELVSADVEAARTEMAVVGEEFKETTPVALATRELASVATRELELVVKKQDGSAAEDPLIQSTRVDASFVDIRRLENGRMLITVREEDLLGPPVFEGLARGVRVRARDRSEAWSYLYSIAIPPEGRTFEISSRGPAQALHGVVVDEEGEPVVKAEVLHQGERARLRMAEDGTMFTEFRDEVVTDENGEFQFHGLQREPHLITVRAPGKLLVERWVQDDGDVVEERFETRPGGVVFGTVRMSDGSPAAGARVWAPDRKRQLTVGSLIETTADEHGQFELFGVEVGPHWIFTCVPEAPGFFFSEVLEVPAGGRVAWDVSLAPNKGLRVHALEANGDPVSRAIVAVFRERGQPVWVYTGETGDDGVVHFPYVPEVELSVLVTRTQAQPDPIKLGPLATGREFVEVRFPDDEPAPSSLVGVLVDHDGSVPPSAVIVGASGNETFETSVDPATGDFRIRNLAPGEFTMMAVVTSEGSMHLGKHDLVPGVEYDLGTLRLPRPIEFGIEWRADRPTAEKSWSIRALLSDTGLPARTVRVLEEPITDLSLLPGEYRIGPSESDELGTAFKIREETAGGTLVVK